MKKMILAGLLTFGLAVPAFAKPGLEREPTITEPLIGVAIAYEISKVCSSVHPRRIKGLTYLNSLKGVARNLGYSNAEIDAFIDNDGAQDRLEADARRRLARLGAVEGRPATYCAVGRSEMAKKSFVGSFLR